MPVPYCSPSRYLLAISVVLIIMAISVSMAILFPYQDVLDGQNNETSNAQNNEITTFGVDDVDQQHGGSSSVPAVLENVLGDDGSGSGDSIDSLSDDGGDSEANNNIIDENTAVVVDEPSSTAVIAEESSGQSSSVTINDVKPTTDEPLDEVGSVAPIINEEAAPANESSNSSSNHDEPSTQEHHSSLFGHETINTPASPTPSPTIDTLGIASPTFVATAESATTTTATSATTTATTEATTIAEATTTAEATAATTTAAATATAATTTVESSNEQEEDQQQSCYPLLQQADVDSNTLLNSSEYVSFLHILQDAHILDGGNGEQVLFPDGTTIQYNGLPYEMRMYFIHQSCKCPPTTDDAKKCCAEQNGVYFGEGITVDEMDGICTTTLEAMEKLLRGSGGGGQVGK